MRLSEMIAEIENDLSSYADTNSIDRSTIKRIVLNEMKRFGNNITVLNETVLQVDNSQAKLPDGFRSLRMALKVNPAGCDTSSCDQDDLDRSLLYRTRVENPAYYNEITHEYETGCNTKIIKEYLHIGNSTAEFYYDRPEWLTLTQGINRNLLASDCLNLPKNLRKQYPWQINITNGIINTNFSKGYIYIQYYGFETDVDGEIIIPEGWHNNLEKYLEFYVKYRIALQLVGNNTNSQVLAQLIPIYKQEAQDAEALTLAETKFSKIQGRQWVTRIKNANRREFLRFELPRL